MQSETRASLIRSDIHCFQGLFGIKTPAQIGRSEINHSLATEAQS